MRGVLVGTAHPHSKAYQETLATIPGLRLVGIVSDGGAIAEVFEDVPVFADVPELLTKRQDIPFEVAFLFLPADQVTESARLLLEAGVHVFCEKPGTRTAAEMRSLVELAKARGVVLGAGYQWRVHPIVRWIKEQIDAGYLGELHHMEARMVTTTVASRGPSHYLFQKERSGGGITHWLGCHHIDLLRHFAGAPETQVAAMTETVTPEKVDVEDLSVITLRYANGCLAGMQQGYLLPSPSDDPYRSSEYDSLIAVRGSLGWIRWDPTRTEVEAYSVHPRWQGSPRRRLQFEVASRPGYGIAGYLLIQGFLAAVRDGHAPPSTGADAWRTLQVIEAIYDSAAKGSVVRIN